MPRINLRQINRKFAAFMWVAGAVLVSVLVGIAFGSQQEFRLLDVLMMVVASAMVAAGAANRVNSLFAEIDAEDRADSAAEAAATSDAAAMETATEAVVSPVEAGDKAS